ncbi:hypothetical protein HYC85_028894 [Camellia sinensis]|uniref:Uncharacterized protein n=1 Tax=Camellia sinensis TaxID=4442 RepID=A0A7J7FWF8_CAMSI|nr:hypothetical protein HYC85_028894 [Camellia sinensis]
MKRKSKRRKEMKRKEKKNIARKVENPQRAALAKVRAQKERVNIRVYLNPNYISLDSHVGIRRQLHSEAHP